MTGCICSTSNVLQGEPYGCYHCDLNECSSNGKMLHDLKGVANLYTVAMIRIKMTLH